MTYRYTCTSCNLVVRTTNISEGRDVTACMCNAEIIQEIEQSEDQVQPEVTEE